jgi:hypothetical protein
MCLIGKDIGWNFKLKYLWVICANIVWSVKKLKNKHFAIVINFNSFSYLINNMSTQVYTQSNQTYVTVPLSGNYSDLDKAQLQRMFFDAGKEVEKKFTETYNSSEGRDQTIYLTEPKGSNFSTARRIKCIVYSFTTSGNTANIKYGACIWKRDSLFQQIQFSDTVSTTSGKLSVLSSKSGLSVSGSRKFDSFKKKNVRFTALKRYTNYPVEFSMEFDHLERPVKREITDEFGVTSTVTIYEVVEREEQVVMAIKLMMLDPVNGGVSSRSRSKFPTVPETIQESNEECDSTHTYGVDGEDFRSELDLNETLNRVVEGLSSNSTPVTMVPMTKVVRA